MPKVSVIMGVYNCENTVGASIESILNQTFQDFEIIVCDDASVDNSYLVLQKYKQKYPDKIKLLKNEKNLMLSGTLNRCIDIAEGEYIARMDADDISLPYRIEKQVEFFEKNPDYDIQSSNYYIFDDKSIWAQRNLPEYPQKESFFWNSPFCHACTMFRATALKKVGGYMVAKITRRCEDQELFMRMYAATMKGYNRQEILFKVYEGRDAYQRRKYRYRIDEARVRYRGYKAMKLLPKGFIYVLKPLIVGLIPGFILKKIRRDQKVEYQESTYNERK